MKKMKMIDSHSHLQMKKFDEDRDDVIKRILDEEMGIINVGSSLSNSKEAIELAQKYDNFWATAGIHPGDIEEKDFVENDFIPLLLNDKVVAVGECGLDYSFLEEGNFLFEKKKKQEEFFRHQIGLVRKFNKPLILHIRSKNNGDAHKDAIRILKEEGFDNRSENSGVAHFFAETIEIANEFLSLGFYISFSGVITFDFKKDNLIANIPEDRILAETDCPYVAPAPKRGERNEPLFVRYVIEKIADVRGWDFDKANSIILENTRRLFGL